MTRDLLELADWLPDQQVTHVAMESTGVYWKPVWNILAGQFELLLVHAHHSKAVPGRKTDTCTLADIGTELAVPMPADSCYGDLTQSHCRDSCVQPGKVHSGGDGQYPRSDI